MVDSGVVILVKTTRPIDRGVVAVGRPPPPALKGHFPPNV